MGASGLGTREIRSLYVAVEEAARLSWVPRLAMNFGSDQASETYKWLTASPALREWVGPRIAKGLTENGITIVNKTCEATLEFMTDDIRRDKTDQIDIRIADLARRYMGHHAKLISTLLLNGAGSTSGLAYDGQYFFDTDHSEGDSGTLKNLLTATEVTALDVTTAAAPTSYEAAMAVLGVIAYMLAYKDDKGEPVHEAASEFLVMTGPALMPAFRAATTRNVVNTGSGAVDNPLVQDNDFKVTHVTNPRLSAWTTNFCVFRTDGPVKPFILQKEEDMTVQIIGAGSEYEKLNNKQLFGIKEISNVGFGLWQYGTKSTLS